MKKVALVVLASMGLVWSHVSLADRPNKEERQQRRAQMMQKNLEAIGASSTQIQNIQTGMQSLKESHSFTPGQRPTQEQREQMRSSMDNLFKNNLTSEQYTQWQTQREQMRSQRKGRGHRGFHRRGSDSK